MLTRLTLETEVHHAAIDAALLAPLASPTSTGYRRFLCLSYGFEAPLETALAVAPDLPIGFLEHRIKSGRIASDLLALGLGAVDYALLARHYPVPAFRSAAQALGWLYVAERTTLLHETVRDWLGGQLPAALDVAHAYLTTYAGVVDERWRELGAMLDHVAATDVSADEIQDAAWDAFVAQLEWLTQFDRPAVVVNPQRVS